MRKILLMAIALTLLGVGCTNDRTVNDRSPHAGVASKVGEITDPLSYTLGGVAVAKKAIPAGDVFTSEELAVRSTVCGSGMDAGHFDGVLNTFRKETGYRYVYTYMPPSQGLASYVLTVLPNGQMYDDFESFSADFALCEGGGDLYPRSMSEKWLVFESSCDAVLDPESELPHGCEEAKRLLGSSPAPIE